MYPSSRQSFIAKEIIFPPPSDLIIPVLNEGPETYLHAWHFKSLKEPRKGVVVHFHGNGQNLTTHFIFFRWLTEYGYDYLIFDYRGYGTSSDSKATPEKTVQDGLSVFKYVEENFKDVPVITIGQSLGSNVLVRTLQEMNQRNKKLPKLVVLDSSFLSYKQAGSSVLSQRWFLYPLKAFAYLFIDNTWSAKALYKKTPVLPALFFHGTQDSIIDYDLGYENFTKWSGPKHFIPQEKGDHTSAFGDIRFSKNRQLLLHCMDSVIYQKHPFNKCISKF